MVEFIIGIFVGALLFYVFVDRKKPSGTFVIDLIRTRMYVDLIYMRT